MNAVLSLIITLLPQISGDAGLIDKVIEAITALIPILKQEYTDLLPIVKNAIATLRADPSTTPAQLDALDAAEALIDAAYETAASAAAAEDAGAAAPGAAGTVGT